MLKFSANHDDLLAQVRERGIEPMGAECIIDLKKAGASDDLLKELVRLERPRMSREEAHARLHQQGGSSSAICGECGGWIRVR